MLWISLVLIYGILKGIRDISKKKALEINNVVEVLFVYTLLSFLFVVPTLFTSEMRDVDPVSTRDMLLTMLKSFVIFIAFLCSFYAIEKMPISLYGVLDLSRMIFSMLLGVIILHETLGVFQWVGMLLVGGGIVFLKYKPPFLKKKEISGNDKQSKAVATEGVAALFVILAFVSTFLNGISGTMDKILTKTMTAAQLQFWYTFFMLVYYAAYVVITRTKIRWKSCLKNYHIWIIAILFIIADKCLFVANQIPESSVTIMTLLKQVSVVIMIIGGRIIYKEKDTAYRMFCAAVVIAGIVISAF